MPKKAGWMDAAYKDKNEKTFRRLFLLSYRWFLASLLCGQVGGNIIQTKEAQRMTVTALCETRAVGNMALGNRGEVDEDG